MKKSYLLALALVFAFASVVWAGPNVGNVTQQGSVLIFPKIVVSESADTFISISNGNNVEVMVRCYWVDQNQVVQDFAFPLTAFQPIVFSASEGIGFDNFNGGIPLNVPPFEGGLGELKCFAVNDATDSQINFNFLVGSAKVVDFSLTTAFEYNAWSFAARTGTTGQVVGTPGLVALDGVQFDACPKYWLGNFMSTLAPSSLFTNTDVTIVPCKEDVRQDRTPTRTKIKFDIWNENETPYSGAYVCIKCWYENFLSAISPKFRFSSLHTIAARFRAQGIASSVCTPAASQVNTPIIGILVEFGDFSFGSDDSTDLVTTASEGFGSGIDPTGFIKWDVLNPPEQGPKRH